MGIVNRILCYPVKCFFKTPSGPNYIQETNCNMNGRTKKRFVVTLSLLCFIIFVNTYVQPVRFIFVHQNTNSTCHLPDIDPFDESIMQYIWHPHPIECNPSSSIAYIDPQGQLRLNSSLNKSVDCFYHILKRSGDNDVESEPEVRFQNPVYIPADFVNVKCYSKKNLVYDTILYNVDYKTVLKSRNFTKQSQKTLNVLIFGLDSVSRLTAERKLIKTMNFIITKLNGYVFKGYTSFGGNTYTNLIPVLTGKTAYSDELPVDPRNDFTDSYPFIWKNFTAKGYVTMFSEDFPEISIFNYLLKGFKDPPVDHYLRPYYIARNKINKVEWNLNQVLMFLEDKNIKFGKFSSLCYGDRPKHAIHIEHYKKFVRTYKNLGKFAFSWLTEISHDYMNFIELADNDILEMLESMYEDGLLKNSVFILMGDHGPRTDEIRNTAIGRIEERMPLLSIVIPDHIKKSFPQLHENLKINENRLTSPKDLHELLADIVNMNYNPAKKLDKRPYPKGISLFRNIPQDRSCADASISEHSCACYTATNVPINDRIMTLSQFVVKSINEKLSQVNDKCSTLALHKIKAAQLIETGLQHIAKFSRKTLLNLFYQPEEESDHRYLVVIETIPGHALFEATVTERKSQLYLLGDVSRTNRYNNQSSCISQKTLKHICFCKDHVGNA